MKKQTKVSAEIQSSRCLYEEQKNQSLSDFSHAYRNGKLDKYQYIFEMHKKYATLFEMQEILNTRGIDSLSIEPSFVKIKLKESNLEFAVDRSCRSALFELLNFGSYEHDEMQMIKSLLGEHDVMFDIGSHLGWYSIILANHYRNARFYAFEPIPNTYALLTKNIAINKLDNVFPFNFGFSDNARTVEFYYSEIGSAVASEKDIFNMQTLDTVKCNLQKLDQFVVRSGIKRIDFIKCDVEGAEFLVIKGAEISIMKFLPILFLELVEDWCNKFNYTILDITSFLFGMGYEMFEVKGGFLHQLLKVDEDKIDNFNFLFLHKTKHEGLIIKHLHPVK
jgi:FkbM family methyltransferase